MLLVPQLQKHQMEVQMGAFSACACQSGTFVFLTQTSVYA